jgi:hypothetical protein
MDTDEEPSSLSLTPETEIGHGKGDTICIAVGIVEDEIFSRVYVDSKIQVVK